MDRAAIMDADDTARKLAHYLPDTSAREIKRLLTRNSRYVELKNKLVPARHAEILRLGLPGIYFKSSVARIYPQGREAAHLLGQIDVDGKGIAGIERSFNDRLAAGEDITLSIDVNVQSIIRRELAAQIQRFEAIGGAGLLLDIETGELVSAVSLPDYNPNHYQLASSESLFNNATKGVFEMGSIFKVLNTAIALQSGATTTGTYYEVSKPLRFGRFSVWDYHMYDRDLSVPEILVLSSNIGSARMAADIGADRQQFYLRQLGLFDKVSLEIPEMANPLVPGTWRSTSIATVSYGHGISVTPLHLASSVAAASGSGTMVEPTLMHRGGAPAPMGERLFSEETTKAVRSMMRLVVSHPDGTGNFAEAKGYMVGGKTGTSEKINPDGGYFKDRNIASFAATFPVHDPRYVLVVMVDEPKGQKHSYGYATGGWVAAPAAKRIIEHAAPLLGILPVDENSPEIRQKLRLDFKIGKEEKTLASY